MLKIRCGSCQKVISVPEKYAGKVAKCPACHTQFRIPVPKKKSDVAPPPQPNGSDGFANDPFGGSGGAALDPLGTDPLANDPLGLDPLGASIHWQGLPIRLQYHHRLPLTIPLHYPVLHRFRIRRCPPIKGGRLRQPLVNCNQRTRMLLDRS